jgi:hypothetical protein
MGFNAQRQAPTDVWSVDARMVKHGGVTYDRKVLFPTSESPSSSTVISGGGIEGSIIKVCGGPQELSRRLHACFFIVLVLS